MISQPGKHGVFRLRLLPCVRRDGGALVGLLALVVASPVWAQSVESQSSADRAIGRSLPDVAALAVPAGSQEATAFNRTENIPVRDRARPDYEALGIPAGGFVILPKIAVASAYDDNVYAAKSNRASDAVFTVQPQVAIESNWNRNAVIIHADAGLSRYAGNPNLNNNQYSVTAEGVLDVRHDLAATAEVSHALGVLLPFQDPVARLERVPLQFDVTSVGFGAIQTFDRVEVSARGDFNDYLFHNGVSDTGQPFSLAYRDYDSFGGTLRAAYAVSGRLALFVSESVAYYDYSRASDRNQNVTETLVGPNFEISNLMTGEIGIGYLAATFSDPQFKSLGGFTGQGRVEFFPTQLLTITVNAQQSIMDDGVAASPAGLVRGAGIRADYELLRNLILSAKFGVSGEKFEALSRFDISYTTDLGASYLLNRDVGFNLDWRRSMLNSSGVRGAPAFSEDVVAFTITLQR
jgi:hypothetical protein